MAVTTEPSLQARLSSGRFVMTAEVVPPISCDPRDLLHKAAPLKGLADAVNVTDGAGARAHMGALAAAAILRNAGIEPILQFLRSEGTTALPALSTRLHQLSTGLVARGASR